MNKAFIIGVWFVGFLHSAVGMTASELQSLIDAADPGATVEVTSDFTLPDWTALKIAKSITLTSTPGERPFVISRSQGSFLAINEDVPVTITNLVFDGNKVTGNTGSCISMSKGTLTLAHGAVFRNVNTGSTAGGIALSGTAHLVMKDGAEIRDFEGSSYGHGVLVGNGGGSVRFDMEGGLITGCAGKRPGSSTDYDGAIYIYSANAVFSMSGGLITGNVSQGNVAGVVAYSGSIYLSGTATITNNVGGTVNDIYTRGYLNVADGYKGRATLYTPSVPDDGGQVSFVKTGTGGRQKGLGRITSQRAPNLHLDGYTYLDGTICWRKTDYIVNGAPTANANQEIADLCEEDTVIEVVHDVLWNESSRWVVPSSVKTLLLTSSVGMTNAICQSADLPIMTLNNTDATIRLERVILRGSVGAPNGWSCPLVHVLSGLVELADGSVLEKSGSGVWLEKQGSYLTMEDGAIIRDCRLAENGSILGPAVCIGSASATTDLCKFTMRGGLITNCVNLTTHSVDYGYGGAIYAYNATFEMTGGSIVGNSCEAAAAGVYSYNGIVRLGGTARIENNEGAVADLYAGPHGKGYAFFGDFRGHIGVSGGNQTQGEKFRFVAESAATGAWCFFAAGNGLAEGLIGKTDEADTANCIWGKPVGSIDGVQIASVEDAARYIPSTLKIDSDWQPMLFSGAASAVSKSISVETDPEALEAAGKIPLVVFSCSDGMFTGALTFTLLGDVPGEWVVRKRGSKCVLDRRRGTAIILR